MPLIKVLDEDLYRDELRDGFKPKYPGDAGIDLRSSETLNVAQGETVKVSLGVAIKVPYGHVGWLGGRSSTALNWGMISHEGKVDSGYRGPVHGIMTAAEKDAHIERGDRIAQLVILPIAVPNWTVVGELDSTEEQKDCMRGDAGLGSTGKS